MNANNLKQPMHEHNFVAEKRTRIEPFKEYLSDGQWLKGTLEVQEIFIFCTTCGQSKNITKEEITIAKEV